MRVNYDSYWKKKMKHHDDKFFRDRWIRITKYVDSNSKVLDVGCGDGMLGERLMQKGCDVWGIDVSEVALKKASGKGMKTKRVDLSRGSLPFASNSFDWTILSCVLEHLPNPEKILNEACRVVKRNGKIVVVIPNIAYFKHRMELLKGQFPIQATIDNREHLSFWNYSNEFEDYTLKDTRNLELIKKEPVIKDSRKISGKTKITLARIHPNLFSSHTLLVFRKV